MTDVEIADYLASQLTIILISNGSNGYPHPMPMHFCVNADRSLAMTTYKKSQKVHNFQRDSRASLLIESGEVYEQLRSVLIYAETEVIDSLDATRACMQACRAHTNHIQGVSPSATDDAAFAQAAARRAEKRLVLTFHPQTYISWDHGKLGGKY